MGEVERRRRIKPCFSCSQTDSLGGAPRGQAKAIAQPMRAAVIKRVGPLNEKAGCYAAVGRLLREAVAVGSLRLRGDR